jgi:hypothetical protein
LEDRKMLGLITPILLMVAILIVAFGISFLCLEIALKMIGKGLNGVAEAVPATSARAVERPATGSLSRGRRTTSPLRPAAVR